MRTELIEGLYAGQIARLHDAEKRQLFALPIFRAAILAPELRRALEVHIGQTALQKEHLESILGRLPRWPEGACSKAMLGIVAEGAEVVHSGLEPDLLEAALLGVLLSVESYETACYSSAITAAEQLGRFQDVGTLKRCLREESAMNDKLFALSEVLTSGTPETDLRDSSGVTSGRQRNEPVA